MTVLSDRAITKRMDELLEGGRPEGIGNAEYYFLPGKLFPAGTTDDGHGLEVIDWTAPLDELKQLPQQKRAHPIRPGELLMLRTRERVKMPDDMCGLWYQTDLLSRDGLLLVNMSVVPPGYQGFLKCVFVNFGKKAVYIGPDQVVAKIVFVALDAKANKPSKASDGTKYDDGLAEAARAAPSSFLQISDKTQELHRLFVEHENTLKQLAFNHAQAFEQQASRVQRDNEDALKKAREEGMDALKKAREDETKTLETDTWGLIKRAGKWVTLALLALGVVSFLVTWMSNHLLASQLDELAQKRAERLEAQVEKDLLRFSGTVTERTLLERIIALEERLKGSGSGQGGSGQGGSGQRGSGHQ
jgi:deoxycytidine triphosphate deaminase